MECGSETGRNSLVYFIYKVSLTVFSVQVWLFLIDELQHSFPNCRHCTLSVHVVHL